MSVSTGQHRRAAEGDDRSRSVACAVLTVSDTRTRETDTGGARIVALLEGAGHTVALRGLVRDEGAEIGAWLDGAVADVRVRAILTTGGTGVARRDTTIDVVRARLSVELEGFGELFRMLSYAEVGAAAMLSRAAAGLVRPQGAAGHAKLVFAMPGSVNAVETAMSKLIAPELSHLVWELCR